jgi:membrane associated rhomboid family serine protease
LILEGEVWRLLTPVFLHADFFHLFFNMFLLWMVGTRLEEVYGSREFVIFYFVAGVFANSIYLLTQVLGIFPASFALGASGAVTAALTLHVFNFPRHTWLLFLVIPTPGWAILILYVAIDTLGALGGMQGNVAFVVHLGGALFGLLYYQSGVRFDRLLSRSGARERRSRPNLRVVPAENDDTPEPVGASVESQSRPKETIVQSLESRVDQLLDKVSKHGQESLTSEERELLFRASELYKKRRK